ncbi:hypothetical protein HOE37_03755 [Candidatus Woesearchaeota archaeon]|jgi:uncharacterized protein (UPF0332 family)|nr:hypothetical protein [Candidatus Woesearchaeota archaeon]MBT4110946.1 hypothetical protein [Candidatus Woesearchaeota archaeon]MBT4336542.1 hypothetical protein [Candidatus Woesearchaeota archaeon]MBT4469709.1 hypothetical protein [Candidatus Woesearchaeota archaeon]MBT6744071.1 hypothetical protein [Candidatus Woesearchaeota archaeon]
MNKIKWCLEQNKGIELVEPNDNLSSAYLKDANDSLMAMKINKGTWKIVTAYYACYNAFYSVLMKSGIKCEIHDCTIELMNLFDFSDEEISFLKNLKKLRIDVQYYLKDVKEIDSELVSHFVHKCQELSDKLDFDKIKILRKDLAKND